MSGAAPSGSSGAQASTSEAPKEAGQKKEELPQLLPLEDDDEFQEFEAEDWGDDHTYGSTLNGGKGLDSLWEDNWDDDDIEDSFSKQLRGELAKQSEQMQT